MRTSRLHPEHHRSGRIGWLRASVLGANDGIISTASLILGVAAANGSHGSIVIAGMAGLAAGAASMAAGEYVSVSSQADTQAADLAREKNELETEPEPERKELAGIYEKRGLTPELALQVADQLMAHDALGAHARDELGITDMASAQPVQAAIASGLTFAVGAALPLLTAVLVPHEALVKVISVSTMFFLALLGGFAARAGGASIWKGAARVTFWGALAMGLTAAVGMLFGTAG